MEIAELGQSCGPDDLRRAPQMRRVHPLLCMYLELNYGFAHFLVMDICLITFSLVSVVIACRQDC